MAKDRRDKTGSDRVDLSKRVASGQGNRTRTPSSSGGRKTATSRRKKKNQNTGKIILWSLLVVLILVIVFFLVQIGKIFYDTFFGGDENVDNDIQTETYDTTPVDYQQKVEYYLLGLLGENKDSIMDMLTLACFDKEAGTVNFLEIPVDTYLGDGETWDVKRVGYVWNNPKSLPWCEICQRQVATDEIKDNKHDLETCGGVITQKEGSPYRDLIKVINEQYSLPVDHYFIMTPQSFVQLVDLVGGVDVELSAYMVVGDTEYPTGVQTLPGEAALEYITDRSSGVSGDLTRIVSCRQVYAALLQRLLRLDEQELFNTDPASPEEGVLGEVMNGPTPIKVDQGLSNKEFGEIIAALKQVPFSAMTMYRMPGEVATMSGANYFSVHKDELLTLLRGSFDPYGEQIYGKPIQESELNITEIAHDEEGNTRKQTMAEVVEKQEGVIVPEPDEPVEDPTAGDQAAA